MPLNLFHLLCLFSVIFPLFNLLGQSSIEEIPEQNCEIIAHDFILFEEIFQNSEDNLRLTTPVYSYNPFKFIRRQWSPCCSYPYRFYLAHREGNGIGYNCGYTTTGICIAPLAQFPSFTQLFLDGKIHLFNNGNVAGNLGLGTRIIFPNSPYIMGFNVYYDYRRDHHLDYNQIGIGFETFTPCWECRINAYFPINTKKHLVDVTTFDSFEGDFYYVCAKQLIPYTGIDAEIGSWFKRRCACDCWGIYVGAGPYYYYRRSDCHDPSGHFSTVGGRVRVVACIFDWLSINVNAGYDSIWKGNAQAQIMLCFPFGCGFTSSGCCENNCNLDYLKRIATQPVYRQDIIPIKKNHVYWWNW